MKQSRLESLLESSLNTASGFVLSIIVSAIVYPLYGFHASMVQMTSLTLIFTIVSVVRSYVWRRVFNKRIKPA